MLTVSSYTAPVDIANRALQHVGADHAMDSMTESGKNARVIGFCYNKLRQAELRRNDWNFAIKRRVLRALDTTVQQWTPAVYVPATTYAVGIVVSYDDGFGARYYISVKASNTGNTPGVTTAWEDYFGQLTVDPWVAGTYYAGDLVSVSTTVYLSLKSDNADLTSVGTSWVAQPGTTTLSALSILYPISSGPTSQSGTSNVYPLPYGFLREADQNPRAGQSSYRGAPGGAIITDWLIEGQYLISDDFGPIVFRFVADVTNVPSMDPMFCEGLAAKVALEVCEPLTQSTEKLRTIAGEYGKMMVEARLVNGIEAGPEQSPEDDFITCRL